MKKKILVASGAAALIAIGFGAYYAYQNGWILLKPQKVVGELKVLSHSPEGDEIPISTDGITVMFNKAVVPLTTLDSGRDRKIPLKITPDGGSEIRGRFFWLGTHGFIFRPQAPLDPATAYKITLPVGVVSVDGYRLEEPLTWEFKTVAPRTLEWAPSDNATLLPKNPSFFLRFNLAMNASDVEKKLAVTDAATGQLALAKRRYVWGDDGHTLIVNFKDGLPWDSAFKVTLPQGVKAKKGAIGTAEPVTVAYATPSKTMELAKVYNYDFQGNETLFQAGKETAVRAEGGVCFSFTQPIDKKSFEKAFHAESSRKPPQPYYYFGELETFFVLDEKTPGRTREIEGYKNGCAAFFDDYDTAYRFSIDPKKIESLSGAPLEAGGDTYLARTGHASPELRSLVTKSLLSHKGPMKIPYRGINLKSVTVRLYRWTNKDTFDESVKGDSLYSVDKGSNPPTASLSGSTRVNLPVDSATMTIDQTRMPADVTTQVPLSMKPNDSTHFTVDLAALSFRPEPAKPDSGLESGENPLSPRYPPSIAPGLYLLEVIGTPADGVKKADEDGRPLPGSEYTMLQVTPVGIAIKRESDHVLAWATDIESGAPVTSLPLRLTLKKWDSSLGLHQTLQEANIVTNPLGVALWSQPSDNQVQVCAEVTQPGSESYSCEGDHKLTGYRRPLRAAPHYFAYLYTDRPIYKPGQKVFFSSFLRQVREGRYFQMKDQTPAVVTITDASGQEIYTDDQALVGKDGVVHGEYQLEDAEDLPRGQYSLAIKVGEQKFSKTFTVASYRKPSFKVDVKAETPEIVSGDKLKVQVQGSYFFGAPMRKSNAAWSIMTSTYWFSPEGFEEYNFVDADLLYRKDGEEEDSYVSDYEYDVVSSSGSSSGWPNGEDEGQHDNPTEGSGGTSPSGFFKDPAKGKMKRLPETLDDKGLLEVAYKPDLKKYPTSQVLTVEANIQDPSHQEVSGSEDVIVHKASFYLGVKPEKWSYGAKETVKLDVVSVDTQGKAVGSKPFKLDVVRRDYKFIEKRTAGGYWDFEYVAEDTKLTTLSGKTGGDGKGQVSYSVPKGGTFRMVVRGNDSGGREIQSATTVYAWGEGYVPWRLDRPETIELVPDKSSYKVGETAKILVKSLVPVSKALVTLERGRLLEYKVIDLGGNAAHIELPVTEGMIPNLYLSVVAHVGRGTSTEGGRPPLLYHGETEIAVEPEQKRLSVAITPDRSAEGDNPPVYRPGDLVKIRLETKDASGKPKKAHIIVSVADESVLRLLNYQLPDLVKKFYFRRPNSVATSSSLLSLKAGDSGPSAAKKRRIFKDTAHFEAHVITNDQGQAEFSFTLPDDLTTWVIEALGVTDSKTTEAFEAERQQAIGTRPAGQTSLQSDLVLTDDTFVGGQRGKIMTTLPVVLRSALPRFAVWGDEVKGRIILNNRNPQPIDGKVAITVSGDAVLKSGQPTEEIPFSVPGNEERSLPITLSVESAATGRLTLSIDAKDKNGQTQDALEVSLPVKDRFAPEVVASAGMTDTEEKELVDIPPDTVKDKGGLDLSLKASLSLAAAPSLRSLVYYPYGCSEQKSASLLAMLMARDMSGKFGEAYFDQLAPIDKEVIKKTKGLDAKLRLLDDKINTITADLVANYQHTNGGMKYWPESRDPNYFASVQVLWTLTQAKAQGYTIDEASRLNLKSYVRNSLNDQRPGFILSPDDRAYGLWAMTLHSGSEFNDSGSEFNATEDLLKDAASLNTAGLAYALMALKNSGSAENAASLTGRLLSLGQQASRHTSWPADTYYWSTPVKNTALAGMALLTVPADQRQRRVEGEAPAALPMEGATRAPTIDPSVPRALAFLLNRKKTGEGVMTQDALYLSALLNQYGKLAKEDQTDFKATLAAGAQTLILKDRALLVEKSFTMDNLLSEQGAKVAMKDLMAQPMPLDLKIAKSGTGRLYYDMVLKYYLPPDKTPTREEGLIIAREYYGLDDSKEEKPLTEFKVGENYKGHLTLVVPQEMNYVVIQDLLPAGFEPVDMTLATTSRALRIQAEETDEGYRGERGFSPRLESASGFAGADGLPYDDVITETDYGTDYGFAHQEIRDDLILWSDETLPPGTYHVRYPVRATTAGIYLMPGATAFEFYEPEIFGRSRGRVIEIKE